MQKQLGHAFAEMTRRISVSPQAFHSFLVFSRRKKPHTGRTPTPDAFPRGRHHLGTRGRLILGMGGRIASEFARRPSIRLCLSLGPVPRRLPPRLTSEKVLVVEWQEKPVRDIAWKAQVRLCGRYCKLSATGKKPTVVVTAIARELCGFVWAIGQEVAPAP